MEALKKIDEWVFELLGLHNCVTIPGLGSFIYREAPASANNFTFELKPASRTVFFNNSITADDGILVNLIRQKLGNTYNEALTLANEVASEIRRNLDQSRNVPFGKLGNFFLNADNQVFFLPSVSLNLSEQTYGLPIVKLDELDTRKAQPSVKTAIIEEIPVRQEVASEIEIEDAEVLHIDENDEKRNLGWLWKAAAVSAIAVLGASGIYLGNEYFGNKKNTGDKAQMTGNYQTAEKSNVLAPSTESVPVEEIPVSQEIEKVPVVSGEQLLLDLQSKKGRYVVLGGMYMDITLAEVEVAGWNKNNVNAAIYKGKNSSLFKVVLNRFETEKEASDFTSLVPLHSGARLSVRETELFK